MTANIVDEKQRRAKSIDRGQVAKISKRLKHLTERLSELKRELIRTKEQLQQKTRRLDELELQVERNKRLAAMGEMGERIAQLIRTPVMNLEMGLSILDAEIHRLGTDGEISRLIGMCGGGLNQLKEIVLNMTVFAKRETLNHRMIDLQKCIQQLVEWMRPLFKQQDIAVRVEIEADLPLIRGDEELLQQALLNLLMSSAQAMAEGGTLAIAIRSTIDHCLEIEVNDTRQVIPLDDLERLFDPFALDNGAGEISGLSTTSRIIGSHGGSIRVACGVAGGTRFSILLPAGETVH